MVIVIKYRRQSKETDEAANAIHKHDEIEIKKLDGTQVSAGTNLNGEPQQKQELIDIPSADTEITEEHAHDHGDIITAGYVDYGLNQKLEETKGNINDKDGDTVGSGNAINIEIHEWLEEIGMSKYYNNFVDNGYQSLDFVKQIHDITELQDIGINNENDQTCFMHKIKELRSNESYSA